MIKNIDTLADRLKGITIDGKEITAKELLENIASDNEVEIKVDKYNLLTDTDIDELKTTVSGESKNTGYVDGMKAGVEQTVKAIKNKKNLEFEGKIKYGEDGKIDFDATAEMVASPFEQTVLKEAKVEPEKQVEKLKGLLEEKDKAIQKIQTTYETEKQGWEESDKKRIKQIQAEKEDNFLFQEMPEIDFLSKKQQVTLFKADGYGVSFDEDGNKIPTKNGKPLKDKMEKVMPFTDVLSEYATANKWVKNGEGRGVGNENPQNNKMFKTKMEAFKHMEKQNIDPSSKEGQKILENVEQD